MDNIYIPRVKTKTDIEQSFNLFRNNLDEANQIPKNNAELKSAIKFEGTEEDFKRLCQNTSIHLLEHTDDIRPNKFEPSTLSRKKKSILEVPRRALRLKTISTLINIQGKLNESHKNRYIKYNKYRHIKVEVDNSHDIDMQPYEEIVIVVRVYEPFRYRQNSLITMKPKLSQRFTVLGSQLLSELRDRIYCQCSFGPFYDISENPSAPPPKKSFDHGFFFISDTFYNDTREPTIDYSEVIREWAAEQDNIGELKTDSMENTQFKDLKVHLGAPHVYQHHGNCEHLFTLSDIRLISIGDSLRRSDYPILSMVSSPKTIFCIICGHTTSNIIVCNSTMHIHDPAHLCQTCFETAHYIDGKKIGEFQAYRYYGNRPTFLGNNGNTLTDNDDSTNEIDE